MRNLPRHKAIELWMAGLVNEKQLALYTRQTNNNHVVRKPRLKAQTFVITVNDHCFFEHDQRSKL